MAAKRINQGGKKRCGRCREFKPATTKEFPRNKALADGLGAYCRPCKRDADREQQRPQSKAPARPSLADPPAINMPGRRGPATTITAELVDALCATLRKGHSRRASARVAGLNEDTLATWMLRGAEAKDPRAPTRLLFEAVLEAEGQGLLSLEEKAFAGAEIDHVQALRLLERRDPESWGRREVKAVNDGGKHMEADDVRKLLTERLERYLPAAPSPAPAAPPPGGADTGAASGAGGGST